MTLASTARKAGPFSGNGATTSFPFTFKVFASGDIKVAIAGSNGVETVLTETTHYTVSLNANQETSPGGTITYPASGSPLPSGSVLSIIGDIDYDQPLDLPSGGNYSPAALENQLDRATIQIQQLKEQVDRAAKLPQTSAEAADALVADLIRLADSAVNIDTAAGNIAAINTVSGSIANVNSVAAISGSVVATGANIAAVAAVGNDLLEPVSEIETVAGSIANVNTVAGSIANVNTVAGSIANVNTVAGSIANVNTVAANVADITNFADVYQGPRASDPTLRNDGSALRAGDMYFNTTENAIRAYSGTVWVKGTAGAVGVQNFSGDGATTAFTLAAAPAGENNTQVYISGVYQQKDQYSVTGTTLTFTAAPPVGTNNIEVVTIVSLALGETDAALVSYTPAGGGAVATTVQAKLREFVSVKDFGAKGDGVTDDTAAINAAFAVSSHLLFPEGTYNHTGLNLAGTGNVYLMGIGGAKLKHTGAGKALSFDNTVAGPNRYRYRIDDLQVFGNANTTDGIYFRSAHHLVTNNVRVHDVTQAGIRFQGSIEGVHTNFICSNAGLPWVVQPVNGIVIDEHSTGNYSVGQTFINPIIESVAGTGISLPSARNCTFKGGTSEGNARGIQDLGATNHRNTFESIWCEANATSDAEFFGRDAVVINCLFGSPSSSASVSCQTSIGTQFFGGYIRKIDLQVGSSDTFFYGTNFSDNAALGITGPGTYKSIGIRLLDNSNNVTSRPKDEIATHGSFTPSIKGTGGGSAHTYTQRQGFYTRVGNLIHYNIWVQLSAKDGTMTGPVSITDLPFTSHASRGYAGAVAAQFANITGAAGRTSLGGYVAPNSSSLFLAQAGFGVGDGTVDASAFANNSSILISGSYISA